VAFNFKPAVAAIETLPNGRRRLRWPAIAFHLDHARPPRESLRLSGSQILPSRVSCSWRYYSDPCGCEQGH
jgi:hypothetical protein